LTFFQHAIRVVLLMAATAALLSWDLRHTEASSSDGLRSIRQAEQIDRGAWRQGLIGSIDHPLHPLGIVAMHGLVGGSGPISWQRSAVALAYACVVLLVLPVYLLTRDVFGDRSAWLGAFVIAIHPVLGQVVANVLSESSFLLFWTWGLWAAVRFLREGRWFWLLLSVALGVLAYLSRPEGLLLPFALATTLALLPLHPEARIHWPRWRASLAMLVLASVALAGPYMILKGGMATRPAVARVLGLAPSAHPDSLEREAPLPPDQTVLQTHALAAGRMLRVIGDVVPFPLVILAGIGLVMMPPGPSRTRTRLFFGIILISSCLGLVRLHATGGYAATRHGLIPGTLLLLAAAHGLTALADRISIPGAWLGQARERYRPGPAVWSVVVAALIVAPRLGRSACTTPGPYNVYQDASAWLRQNSAAAESVLDMTDWSLYFSGRPGHCLAEFHEAPLDPALRWVIVREPQLSGHRNYARVLRDLIGDRAPAVMVRLRPQPGQLQLLIYDRQAMPPTLAGMPGSSAATQVGTKTRR
jgi:4-amino-4-deoxy-L-arabinose transferase-like glycosyltransferase